MSFYNVVHNRFKEFEYRNVKTKYNEDELILLGKIMTENMSSKWSNKNKKITDFEFKVFSQFGEDGIIQYLINNVEIKNKTFIEFGVENYTEANTRFLLKNNNWAGLVLDSSIDNIKYIKNDEISWKFNLNSFKTFITRDNINSVISKGNFDKDIGLLSIDIDGNDYWIWEAINIVEPRIVICEYNSLFGNKDTISIPYKSNFNIEKGHYSHLYFGASILAFIHLAERKGYYFAGCNSSGNNAFFIKKGIKSNVSKKEIDEEDGYVLQKFKTSRNRNGNLSFSSFKDSLHLIKDLKVVDITTNKIHRLKDSRFFLENI